MLLNFSWCMLGNSWQHLNWRTEKHIGSMETQSAPRQGQGLCQGKFTRIKSTKTMLSHNPREADSVCRIRWVLDPDSPRMEGGIALQFRERNGNGNSLLWRIRVQSVFTFFD